MRYLIEVTKDWTYREADDIGQARRVGQALADETGRQVLCYRMRPDRTLPSFTPAFTCSPVEVVA